MISIQIFIIMFYHPKEIVRLVRIFDRLYSGELLIFVSGRLFKTEIEVARYRPGVELGVVVAELLTLMTDAKQLWGVGEAGETGGFLDNRTNRPTSALRKLHVRRTP